MRERRKWRSYLKLVKFQYHITFLSVFFGTLVFQQEMSFSLAKSLLLLYVSFNILLYGGIYTLNDIADAAADQNHPRKKSRPIPSGMISRSEAVKFAGFLLSFGLLSGSVLFGISFLYFYVIFIFVNIFYSFFARNVPYLDLVVNSTTYPLRFLMGASLVTDQIRYSYLISFFCLAFGIVCLRRKIEMEAYGSHGRKILSSYSEQGLSILQVIGFVFLILLFMISEWNHHLFYLPTILTYMVTILGASLSSYAKALFRLIWTK